MVAAVLRCRVMFPFKCILLHLILAFLVKGITSYSPSLADLESLLRLLSCPSPNAPDRHTAAVTSFAPSPVSLSQREGQELLKRERRIGGDSTLVYGGSRNQSGRIPLFFFFYCMAAPAAHGRSWARGRIGAAAAGLCQATATADPSRLCKLCHSLQQCWILTPLSKARDQTCILTETALGP